MGLGSGGPGVVRQWPRAAWPSGTSAGNHLSAALTPSPALFRILRLSSGFPAGWSHGRDASPRFAGLTDRSSLVLRLFSLLLPPRLASPAAALASVPASLTRAQ